MHTTEGPRAWYIPDRKGYQKKAAITIVESPGMSKSIEIALKIRQTRMFGIPAEIICALLFLGSRPAPRIVPLWIGWPAGVIWIALVWFLIRRIGQLRKSF